MFGKRLQKQDLDKEIKKLRGEFMNRDKNGLDLDAFSKEYWAFNKKYAKSLDKALLKEQVEKLQGKYFAKELEKDGRNIVGDILLSKEILDFSLDEYVCFEFLGKDIKTRGEYFSSNEKGVMMRHLNPKEYRKELSNKYTCYKKYKDFFGREACNFTKNGIDKGMAFIDRHPVFVKKTKTSQMGKGVAKYDRDKDHIDEEVLREWTSKYPVYLEELIDAHPSIKKLNPDSVNTVRIVCYRDPNGELSIEDTFMKIGRSGSFIDNGGAGGILVHIDKETGCFDSMGKDENGFVYEKHPDHGYTFEGYQLENWEQALETAKSATKISDHLNYIGWDFTYDAKGKWIIVEGNSVTQFLGQQMCTGGIRKRMRENIKEAITR
ncbi:MAG: hypothetical protein MJ145_03035 [Clostridia bacterium]|nr:hypothetical protein [Clostridia bacterium]